MTWWRRRRNRPDVWPTPQLVDVRAEWEDVPPSVAGVCPIDDQAPGIWGPNVERVDLWR